MPGYEVQCLPQSSGGYAVARMDTGILDMAMLGSAPYAAGLAPRASPSRGSTADLAHALRRAGLSRGAAIQGIYISALFNAQEGLVSRYSSPEALNDAIIGVPFGSTSQYQLLYFLTLFRLTGVQIINMLPSEMKAAWTEGTIDVSTQLVYCTHQPPLYAYLHK
jgi:ABC-type nitrate/sulfonate/bicarbonate transport system substrate-binding protein